MKTLEDLVSEGVAVATPQTYKTFKFTNGSYYNAGNIVNENPATRYKKADIYVHRKDVPEKQFTYKDKDRYFVISGTNTPYSNIKAYIQLAGGKITKDAEKADHIVADESLFENHYYYEHTITVGAESGRDKADVLLIGDTSYNNWNQRIDNLRDAKLISDQHVYDNYGNNNFFDQNAVALIGAQRLFPNKLVRPYDLGVACGAITPLTEDNIKSVLRMLGSHNKEDVALANQMISTFDYKASELLTWKFCRDMGYNIYYLNRRLKAVREFINDYYDKYNHLSPSEFFKYCERRETLTPDIFNAVYKSIQDDVRIRNNPGIWTVKFEMKSKYKNLIKEYRNGKSETNQSS